jgi:hypothetical protein
MQSDSAEESLLFLVPRFSSFYLVGFLFSFPYFSPVFFCYCFALFLLIYNQ